MASRMIMGGPETGEMSIDHTMEAQGANAAIDNLHAFLYRRPISLAQPLRLAYPPPWVGHIPFAFWVVDALRPRSLVELGTHSGNSYCAFLQASRACGLTPACYAIDTWQGDSHAGYYGDEVYRELLAYHDQHYGDFSRLLRMTFDDALGQFASGSVDLLHIDGLHTYEAVSHDFQSWLPKMSSRSLLLMHDINVRENDFGVWRVWSEVAERFPSFSFMHSNGLGVAWLGTEPMPPPIAWLMNLAGKEGCGPAIAVREYFARLGSGLVGQLWADWRESRIIEQQQMVLRADAEVEKQAARFAEDLLRREQAQRTLHDAEVRKLRQQLSMRDAEVAEARAQLDAVHRSTSWRATAGFRAVTKTLRLAIAETNQRAWAAGRHVGGTAIPSVFDRRLGSLWRPAPQRDTDLVSGSPLASDGSPDPRYDSWLHFNKFNREAASSLRLALQQRKDRLPRISVVMPTYNTPPDLLDRAIGSVLAQVYEEWELCIADDASSDEMTRAALARWAKHNPRIKVEFRSNNGNISEATNTAARLATGDFLAFLDHDDELTPDALAEVAISAADNPEADYIYSDDDKIDTAGLRFAPQFKPGWSPTLLLSYMYMGHIKVVRRSLFEALGGFRVGFDGAQDYDFALRMSERARAVVHIPKVLYHWRVVPGSTAATADAKPHSFDAGRRAVAETLERRGVAGTVRQPKWAADAKLGIFAVRFPDDGPKVAIIIPTRNRIDLLHTCLESLKKTSYRNYEIVVVDNESNEPEALAYLASLPHTVLRIANPPGTHFSFARLNNEAVRQVDAEYVLLLNNDTEVRNPAWLSEMAGYAQMEKVGAVGARLFFNDGTVQHAGIVHGFYDGMAGPAFRNAPESDWGYLWYAAVAREYSAVTAACLLTPRALYLEIGGLDEEHFAVAYNDVDYCYRLVDEGWRCVYCPTAELYHHEGKSRGLIDNPHETASFRKRHGNRIDRWYNPNLSLDDEHFRVRPYHPPALVDRPVRATLVTHNLNHEGAPNSQFELTVGLARRGIIEPIVLSPVDGPLRSRYEEAGIHVRIIRSPLADCESLASFRKRQEELAAYLRDLGTEVVYGNTLQTFWAIDAGERAGLPTIWNPRESESPETYFNFLVPELRNSAYACFDHPYRVIFVAHATRQNWSRFERRFNFAVIHNGLNLSRLEANLAAVDREDARRGLGIAPGEVAVVLIGTVCERKGQLDLVRAFADMSADGADRLRAVVVGDRPGPYSDAIHDEIGRLPLHLRERLVVVSETDNVAFYYQAADIALCTSRIESYPRVVLEAMACGLPVVTTPTFGIREQVRENVNALFYEAGDNSALASALDRLIKDGELREALAVNSRQILETLTSYPEMLDRYGKIFREARFSRGEPYSSFSLVQG
jgi:O-antigen biosynthesis protein